MAKERIGTNSQFTGGQLGLSTIGNHIYGFSGTFEATTDPQTVIDTNTGKGYIIGEFQLNAAVNSTNPASGSATLALITFNGVTVSIIKSEANVDDLPNIVTQKVLIPPYTRVVITIESNDASSVQFATVTFVGRVYDA